MRASPSLVRSSLLSLAALLAGCPAPAPPPPPPDVRTPPTSEPEPAPPPPPPGAVVGAAAFATHACVVRQSGEVACWGAKNTYGQLGTGHRDPSTELVKVPGVADAARVGVGRDFSCALTRSGGVTCWGNDEDGQLGGGRGVTPGALSLSPTAVSGLSGVTQISLGEYHGCALDRGGRVSCWGNGADGQLGRSVKRAAGTPAPVEELGQALQVSAGRSHTCAILAGGAVACWGRNTEGQLGNGESGSRSNPARVKGLDEVKQLASGHTHACALERDGAVHCWGDNTARQLGPGGGSEPKHRVPVAVRDVEDAVEIAAGGRHTCARLRSRKVLCWGEGGGAAGPTPTEVKLGRGVVGLALGDDLTCAVRQDGTATCVGALARDVSP